jgi:hypothetical protein
MRTGAIVAVGDLVWDVLAQPDTILLPGAIPLGGSPWHLAALLPMWQPGWRVWAPAAFVGAVGTVCLWDLHCGRFGS